MKNKADKELLTLLVRVYNHSIQYYYHFPEVIIYGNRRLEVEAFNQLLANDFVEPYYADSFGKLYHLSKKGQGVLYQFSGGKKRRDNATHLVPSNQCRLHFF